MSLLKDAALRDMVLVTASLDAVFNCENGQMVGFECTVDSTFTCTVDSLPSNSDTTYIGLPCVQQHSGVFTTRASGTTITMVAGDILYVPNPGHCVMRLHRAGGTATIRGFSVGHDMIALLLLNGIALAAGAASIGTVSTSGNLSNYREVDITPTMDTNIYASGDVWFDTTAIAAFSRANDAKGFFVQMAINDEDDQAAAQADFLLFSANVSLGTVNAAPSISDANARNFLGAFSILSTDWFDLGGVKVAGIVLSSSKFPALFVPAAGTQILYMAGITRGTPTQTAAGIKIRAWAKDEV